MSVFQTWTHYIEKETQESKAAMTEERPRQRHHARSVFTNISKAKITITRAQGTSTVVLSMAFLVLRNEDLGRSSQVLVFVLR